MTKVGDTLWNHRYRGRKAWGDDVITGETKLSWLVGGPSSPRKVNKKTMLEAVPRFTPIQWYTVEQKTSEEFCRLYGYDITRVVGACRDAAKLKAIAQILGVELT